MFTVIGHRCYAAGDRHLTEEFFLDFRVDRLGDHFHGHRLSWCHMIQIKPLQTLLFFVFYGRAFRKHANRARHLALYIVICVFVD